MANTISASYELWTATGEITPPPSFELWTGEMEVLASPPIPFAADAERWTGEVVMSPNSVALPIEGSFEKWSAALTMPWRMAAQYEPLTGEVVFRTNIDMAGAYEAWQSASIGVTGSFEKWAGQVAMTAGVAATYHVAAMNARNKSVTEFANFPFNSFTKIGTSWYAAGAGGLYRLGDSTTDDGAQINWALRTGQHDDNEVRLKRIPEVVLGLRSAGNITVRVHADDNVYYDYALPKVKPTTIHQHRVTPGKGMRSRWYSVELRAKQGADLELASLQMNMTDTTRRLG